MIGKIRKGRSFSGCIRYVTQKDDAKIIASEGVLLGTVEETARSFRWQCLLNPDVAKPVGHIALSFKPEDAPRLTIVVECVAKSTLASTNAITTMLYVLDEDTVVEMAPQIPGQLAVDAGEQEAPPKLRLIHSA